MGQVIFCKGGARHPWLPSLVQVADMDTGVIKWINADAVSDVIWSMDGPSVPSSARGLDQGVACIRENGAGLSTVL